MRFAVPEWLWLQALIPPLWVASWWAYSRRRRSLARFAGGRAYAGRFNVEVSAHRRFTKLLLFYVVLFLLPLILARPQWGTRLEPVIKRGADIVIVLDTSLSMSSEDLAPSRLEQAKHAIRSLVDGVAGDRVALVTFAGQAHLTCPLTLDHGAIRLFLESVGVDAVPVQGTALAAALEAGLEALRVDGRKVDDRGRALVLLTDGEDHEGEIDTVVDKLKDHGVGVYAVGCGTPRGAPIPIRNAEGVITGYKKDRQDRVVTTRLAEEVLERLALDTGGRYYRATTNEVEVDEIGQALAELSQGELGSDVRTRYEERFQIPLFVALAAALLETVLGDRTRVRPGGPVGREVTG